MRLLYNISIYLFVIAMWLAQPFVRKARVRFKNRKTSCQKAENQQTLCVHCASLGEFEQGRPLIEALRAKYPDAWLVLTFFSPSGYEPRHNYKGVDEVRYLPLDTPHAARRFARELKPERAYFIKYEYWYNILRELHKNGCKIYLVSAIFCDKMSFFRPAWRGGAFFRKILKFYTGIFVQDEASAALLHKIGIFGNVVVAGDTRFDRVAKLTTDAAQLPIIEAFAANRFTVVCGSTWPADEALLLELMAVHPDWNFVVAPHEISKSRIDRFVVASNRHAIIYTESVVAPGATLLMVDCIGILSSAYRYGHIAYIGGGFGAGIHNTLEAATWGMPVVFGTKYQKFAEARAMVALGAAFSITTSEQLLDTFAKLFTTYAQHGKIAGNYVEQHIGATAKIMSFD